MKPLSALLFILADQAIGVEAGITGLRDAFFGTGPYAIAPLNHRAGGVEIPQRCDGIEQAKRFRPHQPNECRILQVLDATAHGAWNYCPEDPNANCQIPMACVDEDLCRANQCGDFGNKEYTTISWYIPMIQYIIAKLSLTNSQLRQFSMRPHSIIR